MRGHRADGRNADRPAELIVIYWRDIPAQVTARKGRSKVSVQLSDRFQVAIDQAAVRAGKHTTDDYLEEWRRQAMACDDDLQGSVDEAVAQLESDFDTARLKQLVRSGGLEGGPDARPNRRDAEGEHRSVDEAGQGGPQ